VKDAINRYGVIVEFVIDGERETPNESSAEVFMHFLLHFGHAANRLQARIDATEKFLA
jgi:hypothetical protein